MAGGRGGGSIERVSQIWYIPFALPCEGQRFNRSSAQGMQTRACPCPLKHPNCKAGGWISQSLRRVKGCLCSPMIRAFPGQREDWRLIRASQIKREAQCNPNYCTAMTHLLLLSPIHCLRILFHKTRSKVRMPALSLQSWSRDKGMVMLIYFVHEWNALLLGCYKKKNSGTSSTSLSSCF